MDNSPKKRGGPWKIVLLAVYIASAGLLAYLVFNYTVDFVKAWEITGLPGITIHEPTATGDPSGNSPASTPDPVLVQSSNEPEPLPWDGASRVTVLVMGLDYRDWLAGEGPPRTDTMILLTIDPVTKTAGMLSIPRDLWVNIPGGFGYERINTAYMLGESNKLPDGGPGLAMKTVEELLGVPVDYYAVVEFNAFERFIDEIGGVKIDVPEKIKVDPLGDNNTKTLRPGRQVLTGELALAYVRVRKNAGDDFGRSQRQQQVIMGIRDRILDFNMLPQLVSRSGALYQELSSGIHTNLTLDQVIRLAWLGIQIPDDKIKKGAIAPPDMVNFATVNTKEGAQDVLKPITDKIRMLRDDIFTDTGAIGPGATASDPIELAKTENAKISVLNGTYTPNLAGRTGDYLKSLGLNVTTVDNAQTVTPYTDITFYSGKPYTVKYLNDLMQINQYHLHFKNDPNSPVDVQIILGDDWANKNPMPQP